MRPTPPCNPNPRPGRALWGSARGVACGMACGVALLAGVWAGSASGQSRVGPSPLGNASSPMPAEVAAVARNGVEQKLGNLLPLDTPFIDQTGQPVTLGDYFNDDKPVIIEFAYFECPLLCPMVISGIIDATQAVAGQDGSGDWVPGENFNIITISIDPDDTPVAAMDQQRQVVARLGGPDSALGRGTQDGWHFLTGREIDIKRIAHEAGFNYAAVPQTNDYAHAAVLTFVAPDGEITRYLPGHVYPDRDFRMALTEASEGTQGSFFDMILQLCYHYDDSLGAYTANAMTFMKLGGAVTVVTLASIIGGMLYFERQRKRRLNQPPGAIPTPS